MNPLMQMIGNHPSIQNLTNLLAIMKGKDPNAVMNMMAQKNPQFRQFMEDCKGKTMEQVAQEYGIDPNLIKQFLK